MSSYESARGLRLLAPPTVEPVTLRQAKRHLRVEEAYTRDDDLILALIRAARTSAENTTRVVCCSQRWRLTLDGFPCGPIDLVKPPIRTVDLVSYIDTAGETQTMEVGTDYVVDIQNASSRIAPVNCYWPATLAGRIASVMVEHTSGYTDQDGDPQNEVPATIKQAILLTVGTWYANRETIVTTGAIPARLPDTAEDLLRGETIRSF